MIYPANVPPHAFSRSSLLRLVGDVLAAELARSRHRSSAELGRDGWGEETILGEGGLDLDSLERLDASTALSEFFHLADYGAEDYLLTLPRLGDWCDLVAQSLAASGTHLTFRTSGSTGAPKRCTHAVADLAAEVAIWADMFEGANAIVSQVPSHHIYGTLFTAMLPDRLGIDVHVARTGAAPLRHSRAGTVIVATPTLWAHVARACPALPPGLIGVSSTAPLSRNLGEQLGTLGLDRLIDVYGSSETGGIGVRQNTADPYALLSHWRHHDNGEIVRDGVEGAVRHRMMDHSSWCDDRHFRLDGRRDGAVQIGGSNVFPERVRDVLLLHDAVADAAVRLDLASSRLKAFIVPSRAGQDPMLVEHVDRWCGTRLDTVERPRSFTIGQAVPRDAMGKLADW